MLENSQNWPEMMKDTGICPFHLLVDQTHVLHPRCRIELEIGGPVCRGMLDVGKYSDKRHGHLCDIGTLIYQIEVYIATSGLRLIFWDRGPREGSSERYVAVTNRIGTVVGRFLVITTVNGCIWNP